jgi:ubiquinone/menaquinone biosynthesis C-methylase UbiE
LKDLKSHWDNTYQKASIDKLGWYENIPEPSLKLIEKSGLKKDAIILNVGAGATTLVDQLINMGFRNLIANDISSIGLEKLKQRLGDKSSKVKWILDDLTNPRALNKLEQIDCWHDRAVLHFFNDKKEQDTYFNLVNKLVKQDGFVIIATFNLSGATKCSGLPVHRYDKTMLQEKLGSNFELIEAFDYNYKMPSGDIRPYIYTLFKRIK